MTIINQKSISGITSITFASAGDDLLTFHSNNGTERFRIDNSGNTKITAGIVTTLTTTGNATVGGTLGVTGETTFSTHINLGDSDKAKFGASGDLEIYHDGSKSFITNNGSTALEIEALGGDLVLRGTDNVYLQSGTTDETFFKGTVNGAAELYYDNSKKFETKSDGVDITGELQCDSLDVDGDVNFDGGAITFSASANTLDFGDSVKANFGNDDDLQIYHDGTHSYINDGGTGNLKVLTTSMVVKNAADSEIMLQATQNDSVELYHDNSKKFETGAGGAILQGKLQAEGTGATAQIEIKRTDSNTSGGVGALNFTALDGHSVANIHALGDGDDEGAHLIFRTTSAAGENSPYGGSTSERFRITSTGVKQVKNGNLNISSTYIDFSGDVSTPTTAAAIFRPADNTLAFSTGNNERLRILSGGGLTFNGDTAAANALDDYEEGTHNTTVTMAGDTSFAYTARSLAYTKIGRMVHVTGRLHITGASGTSFTFTLPFTNGNGGQFETSNEMQNIRFNDGYTFRISSNTAYANLQSDGNNTGIGVDNPHICVNLTYFTA